jgi:hypothetical protein
MYGAVPPPLLRLDVYVVLRVYKYRHDYAFVHSLCSLMLFS